MPKVVKSLRVEPELWNRVEAFAKKHKLKVNGAVERLIELGLLPTSIPVVKRAAPQTLSAAPAKIDTSMVPVFDRRDWLKPHPKPGAKK